MLALVLTEMLMDHRPTLEEPLCWVKLHATSGWVYKPYSMVNENIFGYHYLTPKRSHKLQTWGRSKSNVLSGSEQTTTNTAIRVGQYVCQWLVKNTFSFAIELFCMCEHIYLIIPVCAAVRLHFLTSHLL